MSKIRWVAVGLVALIISALFYLTPYLAVYNMKKAIDSKNSEAFSNYVDFPALRESVKATLNAQMASQMAKSQDDNPFAALGAAFATALINPMVDALVTPEGLAALWSGDGSKALSEAADSKNKSNVSSIADSHAETSMSYQGFNQFVVTVKDQNSEKPIELIFKRAGLVSWKLSAMKWEIGDIGAPAQPAAAEKTPALRTEYERTDKAEIDDLMLSVVETKQYTSSNQFIQPESGKVFYMVTLSLENVSKTDDKDYNQYNFKIEDANGNQKSVEYAGDLQQPLSSGSLAPGGKVTGNLVFQVPADMQNLKLVLESNAFTNEQVKIKL